jgi:hypothetical protein
MRMNLATLALALAATAITLTGVAAAGPVAAKQRISIHRTAGSDAVTLIPLTSGPLGRDSGTITACCWSQRFVMRDGQSIEINDPLLTFTLKQGRLVTRNRIEWIDIGNGYAVGTHTWKVVRGTGDYAHLVGHGRGAVVELPSGALTARFEGLVRTQGS